MCSRLVNLAVGVAAVLGGITKFIHPTFQSLVVGIYVVIFGLVIGLLEFQIPPQISRYAAFLFSFLGRGIFYVFIGSLLLDTGVLLNISAGIVGITGVGYAVLEYIPSIEPPQNMRDAEGGGWGAEQV
ncbi:MAG: hypothetical protein M1829_004855 [Trizodia sp. TS-e1964]|nr:MAG: hypothetical protein M1829_004855 [Trizodia sp. TS-e1964]